MDIIKKHREIIIKILEKFVEEGKLPRNLDLTNFNVEFCKNSKHGDLATNVAMKYSKYYK